MGPTRYRPDAGELDAHDRPLAPAPIVVELLDLRHDHGVNRNALAEATGSGVLAEKKWCSSATIRLDMPNAVPRGKA